MRLYDVVRASRAVAGTAGRLEKIGHLSDLLTRIPPDEIAVVIAILSGEPRQGRMGIGGALLSSVRGVPPADVSSLDLRDVDAAFDRIAAASGAGSSSSRAQLLRQLLQARRRNAQLGRLMPRHAVAQKLPLPRLRHGALSHIHLELEPLGQKPG